MRLTFGQCHGNINDMETVQAPTISVNGVRDADQIDKAGRLPASLTGIRWTDTSGLSAPTICSIRRGEQALTPATI